MSGRAPQTDLSLWLLPEYGGRIREIGKRAAEAPDLMVEVTVSSRSADLGPKLALYQRSGVIEYVTILVEEQRIEWRVLRDGSDQALAPDGHGIFRSTVFPRLWLHEPAYWRRDHHRLLAVLEEGLASEECR